MYFVSRATLGSVVALAEEADEGFRGSVSIGNGVIVAVRNAIVPA